MTRAKLDPLPKRADFLRAAARGKKSARPGFVVQVLATAPDAPVRLGLTASRKVGNAVHRNRARRRLRAAARLEIGARGLAGIDIVMIARKESGAADFARMRADLGAILDHYAGPAR